MAIRLVYLTVALAALMLPPAYAADPATENVAAGESERGRSASSGERGDEPRRESDRRESRVGDDLQSCKRDADGMRGPERSRFMTQCLRERK